MWVVRSTYFNNGPVDVSYSRIFDNVFYARCYASEKRRCLNGHWRVEVVRLSIASAQVVEK